MMMMTSQTKNKPLPLLLLLLLLVLIDHTWAQCSCNPTTVTFSLDFSKECDLDSLSETGGIGGVACIIENTTATGDFVTDLTPVMISSYFIVETGSKPYYEETNAYEGKGTWMDGDTIVYHTSNSDVTEFKVALYGENANGDLIHNIFYLGYTGNCSAFPIYNRGDSIGWTVISDFSEASTGTCNAAQTTPDPTCACSPSAFTFELDLTKECDLDSLSETGGFSGVGCTIDGLNDMDDDYWNGTKSTADLIPTKINRYIITEYDESYDVLNTRAEYGRWYHGDIIRYTSSLTDGLRVREMEMEVVGTNSNDEPIYNSWVLHYTGNCSISSVFKPGESIGWTKFLNITEPPEELCSI